MIAFVVFACVMLSVDCAFDALMLHGAHGASSFLGYSPIEGARYYGIGNEVMGAWLGATALLAGYGLRRTPIIVLLFIAVLITLCLGHPLIGAKAGGFIAALLTILGFWWAQSGRSFKPVIAALAVLGTILAGGIGLWILGHIAPSHVSQAFAMARVQGGGSLLDTILRKIGMNLYLSVHSIWSLLLASCILGTFRLLKGISLRGTSERAMIIGVASATAASLALNDAGVVAAAICSVYLWSAAACVSAQHSDDGAGIILLK